MSLPATPAIIPYMENEDRSPIEVALAALNAVTTTDADLPAVQLEEFKEVTRASSDEQIIDADVEIVNGMLNVAHKGWGGVRTLAGLGHMTKITLALIEGRRKVLGKPYGYINKSEGPSAVEVPD